MPKSLLAYEGQGCKSKAHGPHPGTPCPENRIAMDVRVKLLPSTTQERGLLKDHQARNVH